MTKSLKRLWQLVRPFPAQLILITVLGIVLGAVASLIPLLTKLLFTDVLENHDMSIAEWIPYAFPAVYAINAISRYFSNTRTRLLSETVTAELRKSLLEKLQRLNLTFHNSFGTGSGGLMSRILNDTVVLQEGMFLATGLIREPIIALAVLARMIWFDWKLTLGLLMCVPVIIFVIRTVGRSLRKYGHFNREAMENLTGTIKETLDGVRVVQSFNLEEEMSGRFRRNIDDYLATRRKIIVREEGVSPINEFIVSLIFAGFTIYAINSVFGGKTSSGEMIAFLMAAGLLQMSIKRTQEAHTRLQQTLVVLERIDGLLESTSHVPQIANPKPFPREWQKIRFENVGFRYGDEPVLQNLSVTIKRGEVIALVGESGSGKSTIVNLLERFFDPTEGRIFVDETPLNDFDLKDLRRNIALVTQDVFLFRDSIERNIHAGDFEKSKVNVVTAGELANAHPFIERTPQGYQSQVGDRGNFLSGGEKQRISIARAILKDAPVLILDEATSALDSVSELEVQKGLNRLMEGRTVFVIAHRLATVFNADRILVLKKGRLVEQGTHDDLLRQQGEYFNFFRIQTSGATSFPKDNN